MRRYLRRYVEPGVGLADAWFLRMEGSIRVGMWLPFEAEQEMDGSSFTWTASVPSRRFTLLRVTDSFSDGAGGTVGRVLGRRFMADTGPDAVRSAATRAVMESTIVPATLLPTRGTEWSAASDSEIRFRRPEVELAEEATVRIDASGKSREVEARRWRKERGGTGTFGTFLCRFEGEIDAHGIRVPE